MVTQLHPHDLIQPPDLRILPLKFLVEHEYNDVQRTAPLAHRLEAEGVLKNPPIVAPIGDGDPRYVGPGWREPHDCSDQLELPAHPGAGGSLRRASGYVDHLAPLDHRDRPG